MLIGYARALTKDLKLVGQVKELQKFGCEKLFIERQTELMERPRLNKMLETLSKGDTVVVCKLSRLGKSLNHLIRLINDLFEKEIHLISIHDDIDTSGTRGKCLIDLFKSLSQFEKAIISERTIFGLEKAKSKGRVGGRKSGLSEANLSLAIKAYELSQMLNINNGTGFSYSIKEILERTGLKRATYYRYIKIAKEHLGM